MRPSPPEIVWFDFNIPAGTDFQGLGRRFVTVSPDGKQIAYVGGDGAGQQ